MKTKNQKYAEAVERAMKAFRNSKDFYKTHIVYFTSIDKTKQKLGIRLSDKTFDDEIISIMCGR